MVEAAIPSCSGWTSEARAVVKRMVYAAGDLAIAGLARVHRDAVEAGLDAIAAGSALVCDVRMVAAGLRPLPDGVAMHVAVAHPGAAAAATLSGKPRAAEGFRLLASELDDGIAVIGNAPTALLALLDMVDQGVCRPALIVGTPVGFVAAAESKQELVRRDIPFISVEGSRGGSAIAAAAVNALLLLSVQNR